jgi:hypothetical protein
MRFTTQKKIKYVKNISITTSKEAHCITVNIISILAEAGRTKNKNTNQRKLCFF